MSNVSGSGKEPWSFDSFVKLYNKIAREEAGWIFDPKDEDQNPPHLRDTYEKVEDYASLEEYARGRFLYDQRT